MEWPLALALLVGLLVALMAIGLPVALAFFGVNLVGAFLFMSGEAGLIQLVRNSVESVAKFSLTPIALFILMGEVMFHTKVAFRAIEAVDKLIARVPGRLSLVAVAGGTIFSGLSGSTMANTALLGSVLLPEMRRRGYHPTIAMGPILATGSIAILIPPSALAVVLGSLANIPIAELLIAGIVPGLILAAAFFTYVVGRCALDPRLAPVYETEPLSLWARVWPFLVYVLPLLALFFLVVGSILLGWATPNESAALGAVGAFIAAICYRSLDWRALKRSLLETAKVTGMAMFIICASVTYSQILSFSGAIDGLLSIISAWQLGRFEVLVVMMIVLLVLGCFVDQLSMMLITLPFFLPMVHAAQIDPVWFGVLVLLALEISFTTPPFGLLLYVLKGVAPADISMRQIIAAALPFIGIEILVLAVLIAVPDLSIWLPKLIVTQR
jgi:tripartite ATP-independent transporter DctM subunit